MSPYLKHSLVVDVVIPAPLFLVFFRDVSFEDSRKLANTLNEKQKEKKRTKSQPTTSYLSSMMWSPYGEKKTAIVCCAWIASWSSPAAFLAVRTRKKTKTKVSN
jgi:hypothetical protein